MTKHSCGKHTKDTPFHQNPGTKIVQYCTCPAGRVTYNFHSSCKHMHLSFKIVCNKEHKGVICNTTSLSNSSQSTCPTGRVLSFGKNYLSFLDFPLKYKPTSGFLSPAYDHTYYLPAYDHTYYLLGPENYGQSLSLFTYPSMTTQVVMATSSQSHQGK